MAEKKNASYSFRIQPALKAEFERVFGEQMQYSSVTSFFEDCMRALIVAQREGKAIVPPVQFHTRGGRQ